MKNLLIALLLISFVTFQVHAGYKKVKDTTKHSKALLHVYSLEDSGFESDGYESEIEEDSLTTYQTHAVKACEQKLKRRRRHTKTKSSFKTQPNPESNKAEIHATCAILTKSAQQINEDRRKKRTASAMIVINTN